MFLKELQKEDCFCNVFTLYYRS